MRTDDALLGMALFGTAAFSDDKVTDAEGAKIKEAVGLRAFEKSKIGALGMACPSERYQTPS